MYKCMNVYVHICMRTRECAVVCIYVCVCWRRTRGYVYERVCMLVCLCVDVCEYACMMVRVCMNDCA